MEEGGDVGGLGRRRVVHETSVGLHSTTAGTLRVSCDDDANEKKRRLRSAFFDGRVACKAAAVIVFVGLLLYLGFQGGEMIGGMLSGDGGGSEQAALSPVSGHESVFVDEDADEEASAFEGVSSEVRKRLLAFYKKHNPGRMKDVDVILLKFKGRENALFSSLSKKYGVPVPEAGDGNEDEVDEFEDDDQNQIVIHKGESNSIEDEKSKTDSSRAERTEADALKEREKNMRSIEEEENRLMEIARNRRHKRIEDSSYDRQEDDAVDMSAFGDQADEAEEQEESDDADENALDYGGYGDLEGAPQLFADEDVANSKQDFRSRAGDVDALFDLDEEPIADEDEDSSALPVHRKGRVRVIVVGLVGTGVGAIRNVLDGAPFDMSVSNPDDSVRLYDIVTQQMPSRGIEFGVYDDVMAIVGTAPSFFFEELMATYPSARVIVLVRDTDSWYEAVSEMLTKKVIPQLEKGCEGSSSALVKEACERHNAFTERLYKLVLGGTKPREYMMKKKYTEFYDRVLSTVPCNRRKLVDLFSPFASTSDQWKWLDRYLSGGTSASHAALAALPSLPLGVVSQKKLRFGEALPAGYMSSLHRAWMDDALPFYNKKGGQLQVAVVGLDGTGIGAVASALRKLGLVQMSSWKAYSSKKSKCSRRDAECISSREIRRVLSGDEDRPNFGSGGIFHGFDAVLGSPSSLFFDEMLAASASCKFILTVRALKDWWSIMQCARSSTRHRSKRRKDSREHDFEAAIAGGEYLGFRQYKDHVARVVSSIPADRLLIFDAASGDGWKKLCDFLQLSKCTHRLLRSSFPAAEKVPTKQRC